MESNITPPTQDPQYTEDPQDTEDTQYTQVTVDVPQDRVAEFNAFFARFLAGPSRRRGRRGGRLGRRHHRGGCGHRRESSQQSETPVEVTQL
jgi:hypothetical protein